MARASEPTPVPLAIGRVPGAPIPALAPTVVGRRLADTPGRAAQRRARLEALRQHLNPIPFDDAIAEHYADIFAELSLAGTLIPSNDMMVAPTARSLDLPVLVGPRDEAHFRRVSQLRVEVLRRDPS
jgi:predicted nucleic acid-binding protein